MTTDISERGLETLIMRHMTGQEGIQVQPGLLQQAPDPAGSGYFAGSPKDFDRAQAIDVAQLFAFLQATQPDEFEKLASLIRRRQGHQSSQVSHAAFQRNRTSAASSTCCVRA